LLASPTRRQLADWARLTQKKFRSESGLFLIEGEVCVREAIRSRVKLEALLILTAEMERWEALAEEAGRAPAYTVNAEPFRRISSVEASQGIAAVGRQFDLEPRRTDFGLACEQVSDPGNCGALIRVADFFGASELILGPGSADRWNEKVVRGSMGSLFRQPVRIANDFAAEAREWRGDTVALVAHGGKPLGAVDKLNHPLLVLGHESRGLSVKIEKTCSHRVTLKPDGGAESLNLVAAAAVFAFALGSNAHE